MNLIKTILLILFSFSLFSQTTIRIIDTTDYYGKNIINFSNGSWEFLEKVDSIYLVKNNITVKEVREKNKYEIDYTNIFNSNFVTTKANYTPNKSLIKDTNYLDLTYKTNKIYLPLGGYKTSSYGKRWGKQHQGIDLSLKNGDNVYSTFSGVVRYAGKNGSYGNLVIVRHYNGLETYYAHLSAIRVKPNEKVKAGTIVGIGGNTGRSTAPHLHFECRFLNKSINPEIIFNFKERKLKKQQMYIIF